MLTATDLRPVRFGTNFKPDNYWVVTHDHTPGKTDTATKGRKTRTEITWIPFGGFPGTNEPAGKPKVFATPDADTFVTFHDHKKRVKAAVPDRTRNGDQALLGEKVGDVIEALVDALRNYPYYVPPFMA